MMDLAMSRRRRALLVLFFLPGLSMATWVTRTPAIQNDIGASLAQMGLVLLGMSIGSMAGILLAGPLVERAGPRAVMRIGLWSIVVSLLTVGLGSVLSGMLIVGVGLFFFGFGMGLEEIGINIDGGEVERITERPFLHTLHGCFSLGTVCGALIGLGLTAISFPVWLHLLTVALLDGFLIWGALRFVPARESRKTIGAQDPQRSAVGQDAVHLLTDGRLLLIGVIVLGMALAEGAANDWLPILMVDEYGYSEVSGSMVFLGFAGAMTAGRFGGGWFIQRFGRSAVIRGSALMGSLGIAVVVFAQGPVLLGCAVVLWGLGTSLGFPVALSAAAESGPNSAARVKLVAVAGYVAFLVGPPLLGVVGERYGLSSAFLFVLALVALGVGLAPAVKAPRAPSRPLARTT